MPSSMTPISFRAYVSLSQLAEDVLGLSRARVYELIERGALPPPIYDLRTRRPMFDEQLQRQALAVRNTGVGVDGSAVIFYRRDRQVGQSPAASTAARARRRAQVPQYTELVSSLQSLGIGNADEARYRRRSQNAFPPAQWASRNPMY